MSKTRELIECKDRRTAQNRSKEWAVAWRAVPGGYVAYADANEYMRDKSRNNTKKQSTKG